MGDTVDTGLVEAALSMALEQRQPRPGLIHHSDRGAPYVSLAFGETLRSVGIRQSVGRPATCYDNAAIESFFATLKNDLVYRRPFWETRDQAKTALFSYLEAFYNRWRLHSYLGQLSPEEFERLRAAAA
jgi:putative transposase